MNRWELYLAELRRKMRESVEECERAQLRWQKAKDRIEREHPTDAVARRMAEKVDPLLKDAFGAVEFHRGMATMWAVVVAAEIAVDGVSPGMYSAG